MRSKYFTQTTFSFSCPNQETMDMLKYLCETSKGTAIKGKRIENYHFQELIQQLVKEAYKSKPSLLGV